MCGSRHKEQNVIEIIQADLISEAGMSCVSVPSPSLSDKEAPFFAHGCNTSALAERVGSDCGYTLWILICAFM